MLKHDCLWQKVAVPDMVHLAAMPIHMANMVSASFFWHGQKVFWKIDYYDQALQWWCDPLSPYCRAILTVMLACEY
jgi:hypothetical protein